MPPLRQPTGVPGSTGGRVRQQWAAAAVVRQYNRWRRLVAEALSPQPVVCVSGFAEPLWDRAPVLLCFAAALQVECVPKIPIAASNCIPIVRSVYRICFSASTLTQHTDNACALSGAKAFRPACLCFAFIVSSVYPQHPNCVGARWQVVVVVLLPPMPSSRF